MQKRIEVFAFKEGNTLRKVLSFIMIVTLMLTSTVALPINQSYADTPTQTVKKYHLDMGIWIANPSDLGKTKTYTANMQFNNNVKILRVMSIDEALDEKIAVFDESVCTNNLSKYFDPKAKIAYIKTYADYVSTSITNRKIVEPEGTDVSYKANVTLTTSPTQYNLLEAYKSNYKKLNEVKQTTWVPDQAALNRIAELQTRIQTLSNMIANSKSLRDAAYAMGNSYVAAIHQDNIDSYTAQRNKLAAIKANIKTGNEQETVTQIYEFDTESFVNDVFKFWGKPGVEVGSGYQNLKAINTSVFDCLDSMSKFQAPTASMDKTFIFMPTVLEYVEESTTPEPTTTTSTVIDGDMLITEKFISKTYQLGNVIRDE